MCGATRAAEAVEMAGVVAVVRAVRRRQLLEAGIGSVGVVVALVRYRWQRAVAEVAVVVESATEGWRRRGEWWR